MSGFDLVLFFRGTVLDSRYYFIFILVSVSKLEKEISL
jgi:hypothetical protein